MLSIRKIRVLEQSMRNGDTIKIYDEQSTKKFSAHLAKKAIGFTCNSTFEGDSIVYNFQLKNEEEQK